MNRILIALAALSLSACGSSDPPQTTSGPVVFMGDSITFLETSTLTAHVPGVIVAGVSGNTSQMMLTRFQTDVLTHSPSVVVILAGTNDLLHEADPDTSAVASMADEAQQSGARVIIGLIPPCGAPVTYKGYTGDEAVQSWNADLVLLANAHGYQVADYYSAFLTDLAPNWSLFYGDEIHPLPTGIDVMWQVIRPLLVADDVSIQT